MHSKTILVSNKRKIKRIAYKLIYTKNKQTKKKRKLMIGKIFAAKTGGILSLVYFLICAEFESSVIKVIQRETNHFIWENYGKKFNRHTIIQNCNSLGLRLPDIEICTK